MRYGFEPRYAVSSVPAEIPEYQVRTRTDPGTRGGASHGTSATSYGAMKETTSGTV